MPLLITRPQAQAEPAVRELRALGVDARALPLIGIAPVASEADAAGLERAWATLAGQRLVMFVSANAVAHFFAAAPAGRPWPGAARLLAGSTGPGTTAALRAAGVPAACIREPAPAAARFDSEALWAQLQHEPWAGERVLIVRGEGGRDWLADTLRAAGAEVDFVAAYRRTLPQWNAAERELLAAAVQQPAAFAWHFSSSEAVRNLAALVPAARWHESPAYATHARIGEAAHAAGFECVQVIPPSVAALVQAWRADFAPG